jgi:hypothetical protein
MPHTNFESVAQWVLEHHDLSIPVTASKAEITQSLASLYASAGKCEACIMVPDLFPGASLEAIYVPKLGLKHASRGSDALTSDSVLTQAALAAMGNALLMHMQASDNDMVHYQFDDGAQAVIYLPDERSTVLRALGLTLLET